MMKSLSVESRFFSKEGAAMSDMRDMWRCQVSNCGYVYDPDKGDKKGDLPPGVMFEDLPDSWRCPFCGASKKTFKRLTDTA